MRSTSWDRDHNNTLLCNILENKMPDKYNNNSYNTMCHI